MKNKIPCALTLILIAQVVSWSQSDSLRWTPEFIMQFRSISGATISKDGALAAYVVREPLMDGEKSQYIQHIWVAHTDGSSNVPYTQGETSNHSPQFSPDGRQIAFLSDRSEKTQLHVMRVFGGESKQITHEKDGIGSFQWSPDGRTIAFIKTDEKTAEEEKRDKEKRDVIEVDHNYKYAHLYLVDMEIDSHPVQRLTHGPFHITNFDWAPSADKIVFSHKADPTINTGFIETDISWVPSDSGQVVPLVERPGTDQNPKFAPDGMRIAFESSGGKPEPIGLSDVFTIHMDGTNIQALAQTNNRMSSIIDWSSDGASIIVSDTEKTSRALWSLASNGASDRQRLTDSERTVSGGAMAGATDRLVFVAQQIEKPSELFVTQLGASETVQLSAVNERTALPRFGRTELISWTSPDGMEIEGLLTYPTKYQVGKKVPLVLQIHGGPSGVFTKSFTGNPSIYMTQYFADQGFAVLRPNPRGSTGYGKEFRYANFKDWGYGDYEDVMSGVDKVIEMGIADEENMAVMGWSYGGYLTSFLVTRTNRFKAASVGAGLPNLISMVTSNDIPDYLVGHMGGEFFDDYDTYEKHSAIYRIKHVSTPTQVIHGAKDLRVPFTQGQEFYGALKRLGVPTEMLVLPRTPHGPREPKLLMEMSPRIVTWFNKFLNPRS